MMERICSNVRWVKAAILCGTIGLALAACDQQEQIPYGLPPDQERQFANFDVAESFCRHLIAGDHETAYAMTSGAYHSRTTLPQFIAEMQHVAERYGQPLDYRTDQIFEGDLLDAAHHNFTHVPVELRSARIGLRLVTQVDDEPPHFIRDWFYCWINVVHDDGQLAIESLEFAPSSVERHE